jgi:transposase
MHTKAILSLTFIMLSRLSGSKLLRVAQRLQEKCLELLRRIDRLEAEISQLQEELKKQKVKSVNEGANKPSSKQAEWDKKGVGNDGKGKTGKKGRGKKPRKGAGNRCKTVAVDRREKATVDHCSLCGKDLLDEKPLESSNTRIIEDIPDVVENAEVIEVEQQKKYCPDCKEVITAKSELAIPGADIGLNSTILICYLWVALCLPFTRIKDYLQTFFGKEISTSGLSRHVIRVSRIMKDVYDEILGDINTGVTLHADETGWRIRGKNWWLWVFGTKESAYFTIDKSRGAAVVRRVLGEIFLGLLVVDGWHAYLKIICEQQSCMAHLLRKIRKFRDAFPHLSSIVKFYLKLRRILRDGERLQKDRKELGEKVFQRRLKRLKERLEELLTWPNPNEILQEIIKKVKRQQPRILTFVEHPDAPCHNNYGEFLIRIGVLKRKVSGGSVSAEGANAYAVLLSVYVTCKLRGISFPKYMKESLRHYIRNGKPMLLGTYSTFIADSPEQKMVV